jgi:hypothetical protein
MENVLYTNAIFVISRASLALTFSYSRYKSIAMLIKLGKVQGPKIYFLTGYSKRRKKNTS